VAHVQRLQRCPGRIDLGQGGLTGPGVLSHGM